MRHRTFNVGETVYTLLTGVNLPNVFVPAKCIIKSIQWDEHDPKYLVKIIKLYDNIYLLKDTFLKLNFWKKVGIKPTPLKINADELKTSKDLMQILESSEESRYYVYTHSLLTLKSKLEMIDLFNKLQYFLISRKIKEIKELTTRPLYKGVFKIDSKKEFDIRIKEFLVDLFEKNDEDVDEYIKTLQ
jgi:hypothetical protein